MDEEPSMEVKLEAYKSWREEVIGSVRELVRKYPQIGKSEEWEHLRWVLESGPILIEWAKFAEWMDRDEVGRRRMGWSKEEWEKRKKAEG